MSHSLLTHSRAASLINEHMAAAGFASGDFQETDQACFFFFLKAASLIIRFLNISLSGT